MAVILNATGKPPVEPQSVQPAGSPVVASTDQAQAEAELPRLETLTKMSGSNLFKVQIEPRWRLGTNTLVTGLIVDCANPRQTWKMLDPTEPVKELQPAPRPGSAALPSDNNLASHDANFALLRFGLGSPPKLTKPKP